MRRVLFLLAAVVMVATGAWAQQVQVVDADGQGIPLVGVVYDPKVSAFLRYLDEELFTDLSTLTESALCALLDRAVEQTRHPEARRAAVERLRDIESRNAAAARKLWES